MFGAKPGGFGTTSAAGGFGTFGSNTATASPFGAANNTFGKPATTVGAFGATPAFGTPQATPSLFGQTAPAGGLFGASTSAAPAFGATTTTQGGFGAFGQPQQQQPQQTSLFGTQNNTAPNTSLFGNNNNNSAFGAAKPAGFGTFGQPATQTSLFGAASTSQTTTGGFFGGTTQAGGGLFGAAKPAFGAATPVVGAGNGTAVVKYQPTPSTDTLMKNGQSNQVQTKQHCITFMKEYENKSVEELRIEDYQANRKGPQAGATPGFFGATPAATPFGAAAAQPTQSLFGTTTTSQPSTGLFGGTTTNTFGTTAAPAFGAATGSTFGKTAFGTSAANTSFGGLGQTNTSTFGGLGQAKPAFGQATTGLFGQTQAQPAATNTFGQTQSTFGGFGTQAQAQPAGGLFSGGTANTATGTSAFGGLGAQTTQTSFGFGSNTATNTATGGGLFGAKTANTFAPLGSSFGQNATSTAPAFGSFGTATSTAGGSLFGGTFNKSVAPTFGLNTATSTGSTFGGGLNFGTGSGSLFGNTANKPGGLGTTSLFGNTSTLGAGTNTFGGLGTSTFGGIGTNTVLGGAPGQPAQPAVPIHQQILAMVTSPYGDNPIFKDIKPLAGASEDSLKPTNPSAQKAILEGANQQFKVSPKVTGSGVKVKPVGAATLSKKSLFEGLEEYDSTLEESFSLKPNAKRLIIKPKSATPTITIQNRSSLPPSNPHDSTKESFQNQIPTDPLPPNPQNPDTSRRVSWLQSNALDKVRQAQQRGLSESVLDSTLKEFAPTSNPTIAAQSKDPEPDSPAPAPSTSAAAKKDSVSSTSPINMNDSLLSNRSFLNETVNATVTDLSAVSVSADEAGEPHPTGIVLRRAGYYTIPSLDEILQLMDEDGRCVVSNFTIGRKGYGNVYFNEPIDVAGLNLDEIVHFRHKEVVLYPTNERTPKEDRGAVLREVIPPILKFFISLTHPFNDSAYGATVIGSQPHVIETTLHLLLRVGDYVPQKFIFEMNILVLLFLINLSMYTHANRTRLMTARAPDDYGTPEDSPSRPSRDEMAVQALVEYFYRQDELARYAEKNTDAILDAKSKKNEDIEETVTKLLQKAGHHMEHTLMASYVCLLIGWLVIGSEENETTVRTYLREGNFLMMVSSLEKYYNFLNLTANSDALSVQHVRQTKNIIDNLKRLDATDRAAQPEASTSSAAQPVQQQAPHRYGSRSSTRAHY